MRPAAHSWWGGRDMRYCLRRECCARVAPTERAALVEVRSTEMAPARVTSCPPASPINETTAGRSCREFGLGVGPCREDLTCNAVIRPVLLSHRTSLRAQRGVDAYVDTASITPARYLIPPRWATRGGCRPSATLEEHLPSQGSDLRALRTSRDLQRSAAPSRGLEDLRAIPRTRPSPNGGS